eukprot:TRINITY_DN4238_c0_g1_i2.p1 TRINITY_DN4238_c0_g1~~TRINITY_DN4238_c0_g1_i2.p1  ORF type:complete len:623 (-),score=163.51 TRINITY_DN4238_c0_g1_i2:110-1978(-)
MLGWLLVLLVAAAGSLAVCVFVSRNFKGNPRSYTRFVPQDEMPYKQSAGKARDSYKLRKLPEDIDYIIIGSGISGLYCAALLAKVGKKVVVLEQHYVAGGCTHAWEDKGFEFDTGLHYVGRIEKYKPLLDLVSGPDKVEWAKMGCEEDGFCYDEIKLGDTPTHHFRAGKVAFVEDLAKMFPDERAALEEYTELVQKVNKLADMYYFAKLFHPVVMRLVNKFVNADYFKWASSSTEQVIGSMFTDKRLRALLCSQYGNYGLEPADSSFLIHAGMAAHYMGGGYFPVGGSQRIAEALIPTIERAGGRVLVRAEVESICVTQGRATGVTMANGDEISARLGVVSSAGLPITEQLVPEAHRAVLAYQQFLPTVKPSLSHIYAFIGLEGEAEDLDLRGANRWVLPTQASDSQSEFLSEYTYQKFSAEGEKPWEGDVDQDLLMFIGFPSQKDPTFKQRYPGKSTCCMITVAHTEWFEEYESEDVDMNQSGKRFQPEYDQCKAKIQERLLAGLYRHYPECEGKVAYCEVATPLTNRYYLMRHDSYGLEHTAERYSGQLDSVRPLTNIPGLWVTGQDVATVGIVGALNSGILTAHGLLGYGLWDLLFAKRNLIEDLMAMPSEDAADKKNA